MCTDAGVHQAQKKNTPVGVGTDVEELVRSIVGEQSARYDAFLDHFSGGFQDTQLEMYKWLLLPVLAADSETLEKGLTYNTLRKVIDADHPDSPLNPGNLTQSLASVASLQVKSKIIPIILDYDLTQRRLNVVDRGFLIWLNYQDRAELRSNIGLPSDPEIPGDVILTSGGQQQLGS